MLSLAAASLGCSTDAGFKCLAFASANDGSKVDFDSTTAQEECPTKDLRGCDISGKNFEGAKMVGFNLAGATAIKTKFGGAELTNSDMSSITATQAKFQKAQMSGVDFSDGSCVKCEMEGCTFGGEQSNRASAVGADFTDATWNGAVVKATDFTSALMIRGQFPQTSFESAILDGTDFTGADLSKALMTDFSGENTIFNGVNLAGATITDANFTKPFFIGADLQNFNAEDIKFTGGGTFIGANMKGIRIADSSFAGSDFTGANLEGFSGEDLSFVGAKLDKVNLKGANLADSRFKRVSLKGADFTGAFLEAADFTQGQLIGANFDRATITRASFVKAKLNKARFVDAVGGENLFCNANLNRAKFIDAQLANSNFGKDCETSLRAKQIKRGANVVYADFNGAALMKTSWEGAINMKLMKTNAKTKTQDTVGLLCSKKEVTDYPCKLTYLFFGKGTQTSTDPKRTWTDAKAFCEGQGEEGTLAKLTKEGEFDAAKIIERPTGWIGASVAQNVLGRQISGEVWAWTDGTEAITTDQAFAAQPFEKLDKPKNNCALFQAGPKQPRKNTWVPAKCSLERPFVCQAKI